MPGRLPAAEEGPPRPAMVTAGDDVCRYEGEPTTDVGADDMLEMVGDTLPGVVKLSMSMWPLAVGRRAVILSWRRTWSRWRLSSRCWGVSWWVRERLGRGGLPVIDRAVGGGETLVSEAYDDGRSGPKRLCWLDSITAARVSVKCCRGPCSCLSRSLLVF